MRARLLFAMSALALAFGAAMHASVFDKAEAAADASTMPAFFSGSLKALWLIDSATMIVLALIFAVAAVRPRADAKLFLALAALIPAATAGLLYWFMGAAFYAAHLLAGAAFLAFLGALLLPSAERGAG